MAISRLDEDTSIAVGKGALESVLFDFFGTLVNYEPDRTQLGYPRTHELVRSWNHDIEYDDFLTGWDAASGRLEDETYGSCAEFSMDDAASAFATSYGLRMSEAECNELGATFVAEWQDHVVPIPGVSDMVHRLSRSVRLGIVSNTHDLQMVPAMLEAMGLASCFEVIVLSVEHGFRKPHPSIYLEALHRLDCDAKAVAFVGDSYEADYVGPTSAGMTAYLIDPTRRHDVPASLLLSSVLEVEAGLTN